MDYEQYRQLSKYLIDNGRGLNSRQLTDADKEILNQVDKVAKEINYQVNLYRTDDVNWLDGKSVGDIISVKNILATSYEKETVIPENIGNVVQEIKIKTSTNTKIFAPNNGNEYEVDIVRNQSFKITSIKEHNGIKTYTVEMQ